MFANSPLSTGRVPNIITPMRDDTSSWIQADKAHCWHPFTPQDEWCAADHEPLVITRGEGSWLWDSEGRRYLDGNSSIWTNIHGHAHPVISAAIRAQLENTAHVSFLGYTHPEPPNWRNACARCGHLTPSNACSFPTTAPPPSSAP